MARRRPVMGSPQEVLAEAVREIAPVFVLMLQQYPTLSPHMQNWFRTSMRLTLRKIPITPTSISPAARARARERGVESLAGLTYEQMAGRREGLMWEHLVPLADMVWRLIVLEEPTVNTVAAALADYQIVWITIEDDKRLTRVGRADPWAEYREKGIELLELY